METILSPEEAQLAKDVFGTQKDGNYTDESSGRKTGANILYLPRSFEQTAQKRGLGTSQLQSHIETVRQKLLAARAKRPRPLLDDKILTDWNGLMIAALAHAGRVLHNEKFIQAAQQAARFILKTLYTDGRLLHRYRDGDAAIPGMLDDYSFFCFGLLHLFKATQEPEYLHKARFLTQTCLIHFWDKSNSGLFASADDAEELLVRQKEVTDGAIPSGNSVALDNLLTLSLLTGDTSLEEQADRLTKSFSGLVRRIPTACTYFLCALDMALGSAKEVVIVSSDNALNVRQLKDAETLAMLKILDTNYLPHTMHLLKTRTTEQELAHLAPFTKEMSCQDGHATAYVCHGHQCERPVTSSQDMLKLLQV
jgi:hypothetical protein